MIRTAFLLLAFALHADLEDHLKKLLPKPEGHRMAPIDFIYMINLDQRPEKFALCKEMLAPYGIDPYRFSAVNGWELSLETINDVGVKFEPWMSGGQTGTCYLPGSGGQSHDEPIERNGRTYFCHHMYRGSIGIVLSHLSVLQDAWESGYETIWVMEDDIEIIRDPRLLSYFIEQLDTLVGKEGWDILFTDQDTKNKQGEYVPCLSFGWRPNFSPVNPNRFSEREDISPDFRRIGTRFGAYSMIVRRSGMKKILNFFKNYHIFHPFDIDFALPNGIRFYALIHDVVSTQPQAISDNGSPNYKQ